MKQPLSKKIVHCIASKKFFYVTLGIFLVESIWMAVTAAYPMAFDEGFHYGIIRIYASQWSPILTSQPANPGEFGELIHDPSYLYHYLMSFPYRLIMFLFHQYNIGVLSIRFIDILLFFFGIIWFRKLLLRFGASKAMIHSALFVFVLLPVVPMVAGQVNYDNLFFFITPIFLWITLNIADDITKKRTFTFTNSALFFAVGMLSSLVKYTFLPVFAGAFIYIVVLWLYTRKHHKMAHTFKTSFTSLTRITQISTIAIVIISAGLFLQRYGYDLAVYHQVNPDCDKVLTVKECSKYGPWIRNYSLSQKAQATHNNLAAPARNPFVYLLDWSQDMVYRTYFTINYDFQEYSAMVLPISAAYIFGAIGLVLSIIYFRSIIRFNKYALLFLAVTGTYCVSLFALNYKEYLEFGQAVAINGRYLLPFLPIIFVIMGLGYRELIHKVGGKHSLTIKLSLILVIGLMSFDGGGSLTYLLHSEPVWYWQKDVLTGFNMWVKSVASKVVVMSINPSINQFFNAMLK